MYTVEKIKEITNLLENGFSVRQTAAFLGISKSFVYLLSQKYKPKNDRKHEKHNHIVKITFPEGDFTRCTVCGALVQQPCLYCQLRELSAVSSDNKYFSSDTLEENDRKKVNSPAILGVNLKGKEKKRYLEIRKWRSKQNNPFFIVIPDDWPWRK